MAKKKTTQTRSRLIKVTLSDEEMKCVRVSAALEDCSATEFARRAVMEVAEKVLKQKFPK